MQRLAVVKLSVAVAALLAVLVGIACYQLYSRAPVEVAEYSVQRTVKYSFTVKNPNNRPALKSVLWVYTPLRESVFQKLASLDSSHPFHLRKDERGNERMEFQIDRLPPYASRIITVTATVGLSEQGNPIAAVPSGAFLQDEALIGLNDPGIQRMAKDLERDSPQATATNIYNWITKNIKKSNYIRRDMGAPQALSSKSGDCTEFMYLFAAFARANGIPARNMAGFIAKENKILRPADYHNWNEVFIDGRWHLVDADREVFMDRSAEYIATRSIGENSADPAIGSQAFFSSSADIQVSMN